MCAHPASIRVRNQTVVARFPVLRDSFTYLHNFSKVFVICTHGCSSHVSRVFPSKTMAAMVMLHVACLPRLEVSRHLVPAAREMRECYSLNSVVHITPVATKVHVILRSFVVLTWMRDTIELV